MKRHIAELRRVLLAVEASPDELRLGDSNDPSAAYHARLLAEGNHLTLIDGMDEVLITTLTNRGHDLLDLLRDESLLDAAQTEAEQRGLDRDNLSVVLGLISGFHAQVLTRAAVDDGEAEQLIDVTRMPSP